jgi:cephalosporin hydroxylase
MADSTTSRIPKTPEQESGSGTAPGDAVDFDQATETIRRFTALYHDLRDQTLGRTRWLGVTVVKNPTDLLIIQEIVAETRPNLIIETGVLAGGSTFFLATLFDLLEIDGKVVGVDVDLSPVNPYIANHPRVELIEGSSTDPAVVATLRERAEGRRVMVDLDSDHRAEHVTGELRALAPLVTPQCYLVVEDTWMGRTVRFDQGRGPADALDAWLAEGQPFEVDRWRERLLLTGMAGGYLRRLGAKGAGATGPPRLNRFFVPRLDADANARNDDRERDGLTAEQVARNRHQAEYDELRAYARRLESELAQLRASAGSAEDPDAE